MDWLSQTTKYLPGDLDRFDFVQEARFRIRTVTLTFSNGVSTDRSSDEMDAYWKQSVHYLPKDLNTEQEYVSWVEQCTSTLQDQPKCVLVIHERHNGKTMTIPYSRQAFKKTSAGLFQHRSLVLMPHRRSTAALNTRRIEWTHNGLTEQSIVLNCRSDTSNLGFDDDVLLSTTYFKTKPWTFSVMYGFDPDSSQELVDNMRRFKKSAFHPLMMPMMFAECERSRFMAAMELNGPKLQNRMLDLKYSLEEHQGTRTEQFNESARERNRRMTEGDWESANSWTGVSNLKIGMESFRRMLLVLKEQFKTFGDLRFRLTPEDSTEKILDLMSSEIIGGRLDEMNEELNTKIRQCEGLLDGLTLAIQVEWNSHTRRHMKANLITTRLAHQDSTRLKLVDFVGVIFLPGTFLATLFSMTFFRWLPDNSPQMVSPYIAVYFGLTAVITAVTILFWRWNTRRSQVDPALLLSYALFDPEDLEQGLSTVPERSPLQESDSSEGTDVEMQAMRRN